MTVRSSVVSTIEMTMRTLLDPFFFILLSDRLVIVPLAPDAFVPIVFLSAFFILC